MTSATAPLGGAAHPWSSDALLIKAQRYAQTMLSHPRDDWQFAFWSTLTLELVARAALARVSPILLADEKDWNNLLFALGHNPTAAKFVPRSLGIATLLSRLQKFLPEFTPELETFCLRHMARRNDELHTGTLAFDAVGTSQWLPSFYAACDCLLGTLGEGLDLLLGGTEAQTAMTMIAAAQDKAAMSVREVIAARKALWEDKSPDERADLVDQAKHWATRQGGHRVPCPSCGCVAKLTGSPVAPPIRSIEDDLITEKQGYLPSGFECIACGLKISGFSQLNAASLGDTFTATHTFDAAEYYAPPEDEHEGWEQDFNEF